jgi:hypothetical protein
VKPFSVFPEIPGETQLYRGAYIILLNALSIPPHLLASVDGTLYSITVAGQHAGSPLDKFLQLVHRKKAPTLFVEWKLPAGWSTERLESELRKNVGRYTRVEEGKASCLSPIRDTAATLHGPEMHSAGFIFELFPLMQTLGALGETFGLHMESAKQSDGSFHLLTYDSEELRNAIVAAKKKVIGQ